MSTQPPRKRMKAGVTRVRTGCYTCRRRKVKCDEEKPECRACSQLDLKCEGYALRYKFCDPQILSPNQWPATVSNSPGRVPTGLNSPDPSLQSISSRPPILESTDGGVDVFSSLFDDREPPGTESLEDSAGPHPSTAIDALLSPSYGAFLDAVWNWPDMGMHIMASGMSLLSPNTDGSPSTDDTSSPSHTQNSAHIPSGRTNSDPASPPSPRSQISNNPSGLRDYYLSQWHKTVVPLLPPVFRDLTADMPDFLPLQNAVLAISASYVAHVESLIVRSAHRSKKSYYIPQKDHQYQSLQYYNKVIQSMGTCLEMLPQAHFFDMLAALLLSYYFELDSGSFTGGMRHMAALDKLMLSHNGEIRAHATGRRLLSTWMNLRSQFVNRYLGSCIPSMSAHRIDTFPLNRTIGLDEGASHHDAIMIMTCDAKFLSRKMILDWCVTRGEARGIIPSPLGNILAQMSLPAARKDSALQLAAIDNAYVKSMCQQRIKLDSWHASLDMAELPVDSYVSQPAATTTVTAAATDGDTLDIRPLKFHTFEAAMNYAHYAHTQMLCAAGAIARIRDPVFVVPPLTRRDCPWGELILRITAGLTIDDCVYKNTFNAGMLLILTSCMVLCPRADVAAWIEDWVHRIEDFGVPLESGLPFGIIKRIIHFVLDQRQLGSDILLILPLETEDAEKSDLYQSDFKMHVVVCGKDLRTGQLYNETVEIPEV